MTRYESLCTPVILAALEDFRWKSSKKINPTHNAMDNDAVIELAPLLKIRLSNNIEDSVIKRDFSAKFIDRRVCIFLSPKKSG